MILSMTGYGSAQKSFSDAEREFEISLEIKSLNSKYFDLSLRGPKQFNALESRITKMLKSRFTRGRFDIYVNRRVLKGKTQDYAVNETQALDLANQLKAVAQNASLSAGVSVSDLLYAPEWLQSKDVEQDLEHEWSCLEEVLKEACDHVEATRAEEGKGLSKIFGKHCAQLEEGFSKVREQGPLIAKALKGRVKERVKDLAGEIELDPQRLEQEIVYFVTRSDFTEEIDRFSHHLDQLKVLLEKKESIGRRLEFLIQEMHRELNTMGSKCSEASLTSDVMELKAIVDRLREQSANVE